ncbi:type II toxin-antitoxin system YoeB family toxin [Empedobacter falsenii]|uniref:type II toxin-antitoxin system YoeB family toxin n=1 Tax=Empedobacter falsenii TaxID=343874 RepID=UPI00257615CF|nr:type II toxin-antitoxin system YoeB family toxin [Empedobacter falsenii]
MHPEKGTGHPKPLGGNRVGEWSRKITDKHRLIYTIDNDQVIVLVISAYGHYDDK